MTIENPIAPEPSTPEPVTPLVESTSPTVSPVVRTTSYWAGAVAPVVGALVVSLTAIWAPSELQDVTATSAAVVGAISSWAGILGIAYRPTK